MSEKQNRQIVIRKQMMKKAVTRLRKRERKNKLLVTQMGIMQTAGRKTENEVIE